MKNYVQQLSNLLKLSFLLSLITLFISCGGVKEDHVESLLDETWTAINSKNMGGYYIEAKYVFKIKEDEDGYSYSMTISRYDAYSGNSSSDDYSGKMEKKYEKWSGTVAGMNSKRTYWKFEGLDLGLLLEKNKDGDKKFVNRGKVQFQIFNGEDPRPIIMAK